MEVERNPAPRGVSFFRAGNPQVLSYRHGFHAGNHADVLKHVAWVALLRFLTRKDKPLVVVDTHAGAGLYSLEQGFAARNAEFRDGIARLWERNRKLPYQVDSSKVGSAASSFSR